jgi:hypothetical protein
MLRAGARVAVRPEVAAIHRLVNPRSIYVRSIGESLRERGLLAAELLAGLASRSELTPERRRVLAAEAMRHARILWEAGPREYGRAVERALSAVLPEAGGRAGPSGRVWPRLYRWFGFDVAEQYDVFRRFALPSREARPPPGDRYNAPVRRVLTPWANDSGSTRRRW